MKVVGITYRELGLRYISLKKELEGYLAFGLGEKVAKSTEEILGMFKQFGKEITVAMCQWERSRIIKRKLKSLSKSIGTKYVSVNSSYLQLVEELTKIEKKLDSEVAMSVQILTAENCTKHNNAI